MKYLAIDPGVKAVGLAWRTADWGGVRPILVNCYQIGSTELREVLLHAHRSGCTHAVIEQPIGYGSVRAAFKLCEARGRLVEACERTGLIVVGLHVSTWQAAMLGKDRKGRTKELSIMSAKSLGVDTDDDNEADAVNILVYAELNELGEEDA